MAAREPPPARRTLRSAQRVRYFEAIFEFRPHGIRLRSTDYFHPVCVLTSSCTSGMVGEADFA